MATDKVVEVFEIVLDGEADDVCPAAPEPLRGRIQRMDHGIRQPRCHRAGHGWSTTCCKAIQKPTIP